MRPSRPSSPAAAPLSLPRGLRQPPGPLPHTLTDTRIVRRVEQRRRQPVDGCTLFQPPDGEPSPVVTSSQSVSTVTRAFANLDRPTGTILGLDEPELGLSHGYACAYALGRYIGEQALQLPRPCGGVVVVTHSRELVRGLVDGDGREPTFISVGADAALDTWLAACQEHTVDELLALNETGHERFLWAQATLRSSSRRA